MVASPPSILVILFSGSGRNIYAYAQHTHQIVPVGKFSDINMNFGIGVIIRVD